MNRNQPQMKWQTIGYEMHLSGPPNRRFLQDQSNQISRIIHGYDLKEKKYMKNKEY